MTCPEVIFEKIIMDNRNQAEIIKGLHEEMEDQSKLIRDLEYRLKFTQTLLEKLERSAGERNQTDYFQLRLSLSRSEMFRQIIQEKFENVCTQLDSLRKFREFALKQLDRLAVDNAKLRQQISTSRQIDATNADNEMCQTLSTGKDEDSMDIWGRVIATRLRLALSLAEDRLIQIRDDPTDQKREDFQEFIQVLKIDIANELGNMAAKILGTIMEIYQNL